MPDRRAHAVCIGKLKALDGQFCHLLHRGGSENDHAEIAVSAALGSLEIVGLAGLNTAKSGTASLYVNHQCRQICSCKIGKSFAFEGDSGAGGGGHDSVSRRGNAVNHIDRSDLTLCLEEGAADLGHLFCHVCGDLGLGGDGIAEIMSASRMKRRLGDGFISLH